jgi:FtsH-binding integral membrane protein
MLIQKPDTLPADYMGPIDTPLWILTISLMYLVGFIIFKRSRSEDLIQSQKSLFRAYAEFLWIMGITRILFVLAYLVNGFYKTGLTWGYFFGALSLIDLIRVLEKYITPKTKFFFTGFSIVITVITLISVFLPDTSETIRLVQQMGMPVIALLFIALFGVLIKKSTGKIKKKAIQLLVAIFIIVLGIILDSENLVLEKNILPVYIAPLVFSTGVLLFGYATSVEK